MYLYRLGCNLFIIKLKSHILLAFALLFAICKTEGQDLIYNLNKSNGLPTNHVYCAIVDHNGYLWLGTENGVVRYNGYKTKTYDYKDGLANVDVWELYEDKQHRILLHSIARGMGYIRNNKHKSFYLKNFDSEHVKLMPADMYQINDTIRFWNKIGSAQLGGDLTDIVGDTVYFHNEDFFNKLLQRDNVERADVTIIYMPKWGRYNLQNDKLYKVNIDGSQKKVCDINDPSVANNIIQSGLALNDLFLSYLVGNDSLFFINFRNCKTGKIQLPQMGQEHSQKIQYLYKHNDRVYIISNNYIFVYNDNAKLEAQFKIEELLNDPSLNYSSISYLINDPVWGTGVTTYSNGLLLNFKQRSNSFKRTSNNYSSTKYLGKGPENASYWWDKKNNELITIKNGVKTHSIRINGANIPYSSNTIEPNIQLLLSRPKNVILTPHGQFYLSDHYKYIKAKGFGNVDNYNRQKLIYLLVDNALSTIAIINDSTFYGISNSATTLQHYAKKKDTLSITMIKEEKYKKLLYNSYSKDVIAYNDDIIFFYNTETKKSKTIGPSALKKKGINRVESIFAYDQAYVLIQGYSDLYLLNTQTGTTHSILDNYSLDGSIIDVTNKLITVGGRFGIGQYRLINDSLITENLFLNIKSLCYNQLLNMCVYPTSILLGTDNGSYEIDLKNTSSSNISTTNRLIISYNDTVQQLLDHDTFALSQDQPFINFDAINPTGFGTLQFKYKIGNQPWKESDGNNINIYDLSPNKYYQLRVVAFDAAWSSKPTIVTLFIKPYWWQTGGGLLTIILLGFIVVAAIIIIAIIITRKRIEQVNQRKNQQRDLELKSIYSQINPHFIFNTLGTAQYFIKKNKTKEAYAHISQFSDLLRAYLKSSRDKYISITEEVENLKNYLELQLSRFEHKFIYDISVDKSINPDTTTIPSLLLQPIVENALNHGIFHMDGLGQLNIKFLKENNNLICIVDDNGIGRKKSKQLRNSIIRKADSYGTILIKELIDTFNKYEPININIEYIDKEEPLTGTSVIISVNKKSNNGDNK